MSLIARESASFTDRACRVLVAAVVLLFPASCLLVDRSDSVSLLLLGLIGVCAGLRHGFRSQLPRLDWWVVGAFSLFFAVVLLSFELGHQTDDGFRLLGRYLRLMFALPVLLALRRYRPAPLLVWSGLGIAALALGVDTVWERIQSHSPLRPEGDTNVAILFGDLSAMTAFAVAAGYIYIDTRLPRSGPWLVSLCAIAGLLASILSGTRGAWIAMPVLLVLFVFARHILRVKTLLFGAGAVFALFIVSYFVSQTHLQERVSAAVTQVRAYFLITGGIRQTARPVCLNQPVILRTLADMGVWDRRTGLQVRVEDATRHEQAYLQTQGCRGGAALVLHNTADRSRYFVLGHTAAAGQHPVTAHMLARGRASMRFMERGAVFANVDNPKFHRVTLAAPDKRFARIRVNVPGGDTFALIPIESYTGEFTDSLLLSPIGQRLEMWRAATTIFVHHPLLGAGTGAYQPEAQQLAESGRISSAVTVYDHPHNDYFDALASRGILGLFALLAMFGVPGWLFFRALSSSRPEQASAALAGLLVTAGFAIFSLTETMFIHSVTIGWYLIMISIFLSFVDDYEPGNKGKSE